MGYDGNSGRFFIEDISAERASEDEARGFQPPSATMYKEVLHHTRWIATSEHFEGRRSKNFGGPDGYSDFSAMVCILRMVRGLRTRRSGQPCSWEFVE